MKRFPHDWHILGGGLAGLTLGLELRRQGLPVTLHEAGQIPRHRVCGEFLSGRGQEILASTGLLPELRARGLREAGTVRFFQGSHSTPRLELPRPAWCLSRPALDGVLLERFQELGGRLITGERAQPAPGSAGWVQAGGRRRATAGSNADLWFGLKCHARNLELSADLEVHVMPGGYLGICRVEAEAYNLCGLFRKAPGQDAPGRDWMPWVARHAGARLEQHLQRAEWLPETKAAIAGLPNAFLPPGPPSDDVWSIGDALGMMPPATGNGMSFAIETASLAGDCLARSRQHNHDWAEACRDWHLRSRPHRRRLRRAWRLHPLMLQPNLCSGLLLSWRCWPGLFRHLCAATR